MAKCILWSLLALRPRRKLAGPHPHTGMYVSIIGIFNVVSYPEKPDKRFLPEPLTLEEQWRMEFFALHRVFLLSCNLDFENESVDKLD
jgi:hypothetical protein